MNSFLKVLFRTALASVMLVTVIGYFDEGHPRIYGSFANYIAQQGWPPLSDYAVWLVIFELVAIFVWLLVRGVTRTWPQAECPVGFFPPCCVSVTPCAKLVAPAAVLRIRGSWIGSSFDSLER